MFIRIIRERKSMGESGAFAGGRQELKAGVAQPSPLLLKKCDAILAQYRNELAFGKAVGLLAKLASESGVEPGYAMEKIRKHGYDDTALFKIDNAIKGAERAIAANTGEANGYREEIAKRMSTLQFLEEGKMKDTTAMEKLASWFQDKTVGKYHEQRIRGMQESISNLEAENTALRKEISQMRKTRAIVSGFGNAQGNPAEKNAAELLLKAAEGAGAVPRKVGRY